MKIKPFSLIPFLSVFLAAVPAFAVPAESLLTVKGAVFSYIGSHPLQAHNSQIEEALIIVHGSERNVGTYYSTGEILANQLNKKDKLLIIAPHFKIATDPLQSNEVRYTWEGWLSGDGSTKFSISSFEVMDEFVRELSNKAIFPNLKSIVITGHSAGGQLTQRYALSTLVQPEGVKIRYVVANPGSYAYLDKKRLVNGKFEIPKTGCTNYNDYKYGLDHVNAYVGQSTTLNLMKQYLSRDVTYLLGENDTDVSEIDNDCPAVLQGVNRLQRGKNFKASLNVIHPTNKHKLATVPGVGHSERLLYISEVGKQALFTAPSPVPGSRNKK